MITLENLISNGIIDCQSHGHGVKRMLVKNVSVSLSYKSGVMMTAGIDKEYVVPAMYF